MQIIETHVENSARYAKANEEKSIYIDRINQLLDSNKKLQEDLIQLDDKYTELEKEHSELLCRHNQLDRHRMDLYGLLEADFGMIKELTRVNVELLKK